MQKKFNWSILNSIMLAVIILGGIYAMTQIPTAEDLDKIAKDAVATIEIPEMPVIPTVDQIVSAINFPDNSVDLTEVLEGVYEDEANQLERDCISGLQGEYSQDDVLEAIQDLIEDDEGEDIENLRILDWNYNRDYDFDITNLGLDEEDNRAAKITDTIRVSYNFEDGNTDTIKDKVYATANCGNWDSDDNEFDFLTVDFSLTA